MSSPFRKIDFLHGGAMHRRFLRPRIASSHYTPSLKKNQEKLLAFAPYFAL
jgi:hypothetical protein